MPYVITTLDTARYGEPMEDQSAADVDGATRTAVATRDEVAALMLDRFDLRWHMDPEEEVADVGPLPGGTVIEVKSISPMRLRSLAGVPAVALDDEALAAFNAQQ